MSYFNRVTIADSNNNVINPASTEDVVLLRKIVKLLESNATIDAKQRQRVVVEAIGTNTGTPTEVNAAIPVTNTLAASTANIGQIVVGFGGQATAAGNIVDSRFFLMDTARNAYAAGIRGNLVWQ